jgi:hypothetical protein
MKNEWVGLVTLIGRGISMHHWDTKLVYACAGSNQPMAMSKTFVCSACSFTVESWDDGNPFFIQPDGAKRYVYHPDPDRDLAIANDVPQLCLACGAEFNVDSRTKISITPCCGSASFSQTYKLTNKPCPKCKTGKFKVDKSQWKIS